MSLKELEITEETKETLFNIVEEYKDTVKWLAIDCYVAGIDLYKGVLEVHGILQQLEDVDYLEGIKTVLILSYPSDEPKSKIKVRLFDKEPKIAENIVIQ